jgi:nucleoside-diphosphate-sugar epimerase
MKKILITGATGFIGGFLVEEALSRGYEVHAGVRATSNRRYLDDPRIKFIDLAYNDVEQMFQQLTAAGRFDYVIHNMGVTKCNNKDDFNRINCACTRNFVDALNDARLRPDKFVYMSSLSAWGAGNPHNDQPIRLADPPHPDTLYGQSKLRAEEYIAAMTRLPYIFLRPTGVYGPREKDYFVFDKTVARGIVASMGFDTQYLTFIYVRDLARLALDACTADVVRKGYFVADGKVYTNTEYANIVKRHLGRRRTLTLRVPLFAVKAIAYTLDAIYGLFGKSPTLNRDKYKILRVMNWRCETAPTERDFNFVAQYDLDKGTEETIKWYREHGWL